MGETLTKSAPAVSSAGMVRVPEERVIEMIATCAQQIHEVRTVVDAKEVTTVAQAIDAIARKIHAAKEVKRAALKLLVEAESKLGEVLLAVPKAEPGVRTPGGKTRFLAEQGINKRRASLAQRLASLPKADVDKVIEDGAKTIHAVTTKLNLLTDGSLIRQQRASALAFLCEEAIQLLERSVKEDKVPHAGTVQEMVNRFRTITAHGNLKDC